jgi:phosphatidylethanolamine-binding protein (PEBP) family uncharacterized protein
VDLFIASRRRRAERVKTCSAQPLGAAALALALALAVAGCGSSGSGSDTTASKSPASSTSTAPAAPPTSQGAARPNVATIGFETSGRNPDGTMAKKYTCRGADISPAFSWTAVPPNAKELVVVVRTVQRGQITTNWSVAGLSPSRIQLRPGHVPPGAVVGLNSYGEAGYKLCPPSGKPALVAMGIYAVPYKLNLHNGFAQGALSNVVGAPNVAWGSAAAYYPR